MRSILYRRDGLAVVRLAEAIRELTALKRLNFSLHILVHPFGVELFLAVDGVVILNVGHFAREGKTRLTNLTVYLVTSLSVLSLMQWPILFKSIFCWICLPFV